MHSPNIPADLEYIYSRLFEPDRTAAGVAATARDGLYEAADHLGDQLAQNLAEGTAQPLGARLKAWWRLVLLVEFGFPADVAAAASAYAADWTMRAIQERPIPATPAVLAQPDVLSPALANAVNGVLALQPLALPAAIAAALAGAPAPAVPPPQAPGPVPAAAIAAANAAHVAFVTQSDMGARLHAAAVAVGGPWPLPANFAIAPLPGHEPAFWAHQLRPVVDAAIRVVAELLPGAAGSEDRARAIPLHLVHAMAAVTEAAERWQQHLVRQVAMRTNIIQLIER